MENIVRYQQAKKVTLIGALINALLGIFKILIGILGHSQALVADGIHSISDLITDAMVLFAAKAGAHGPDENHPYGHGRFETLATVALSVLLIFVGLGIALEGFEHIVTGQYTARPSFTVLFAAAVSVLANEFLFRYTLVVSKRIRSDLLKANAWHHRSDALSSVVVLIGAALTLLNIHWGDAVAAIIVAGMIIKMALKMAWQSLSELVDTGVDEATKSRLERFIMRIEGVSAVHQLRSRLVAGEIYLDVHVQVAPDISVSEGHYISEKVMAALRKQFKKVADITVHIDPEDDENVCPSFGLPNRAELMEQLSEVCSTFVGWEQRKKLLLHYLNGDLYMQLVLPISVLENLSSAQELQKEYHEAVKKLNSRFHFSLYFSSID